MTQHSASLAQRERHALADLMIALGPDAPTLCEGWATQDLVAHLVVRESRPDAAAGMAIPQLAGHLTATMQSVLAGGYLAAVETMRSGPPKFSLFGLPKADELANTAEFFIHHEDVRRAQPEWSPRLLDDADTDRLWSAARQMSRLALRKEPSGIVLVVPDGPRAKVKGGSPVRVVTGTPSELLMWVAGRRDHAEVTVR